MEDSRFKLNYAEVRRTVCAVVVRGPGTRIDSDCIRGDWFFCSAQEVGGAVLLHEGSIIALRRSTFRDNVAAFAANNSNTRSDSTGVANMGGQVQCGTGQYCLPVCTACRDDIPSSRPTLQPTAATASNTTQKETAGAPWLIRVSIVGFIFITGSWVVRRHPTRCKRYTAAERPQEEEQTAGLLLRAEEQPRIELDTVHELGAMVELVEVSRFLRTQALTIMIGRSDLGIIIKLWSAGMSNTVPMQVDPLGRLLTDLPFVNTNDGIALLEKVGRIFESPDEPDDEQDNLCILHLRTQRRGAVLLEMTMNVFVTTEESIIIMVGRELDSGLAGFLRNEHDSVMERHLFQQDLNETNSSTVSSLTEATFCIEHEQSSSAASEGESGGGASGSGPEGGTPPERGAALHYRGGTRASPELQLARASLKVELGLYSLPAHKPAEAKPRPEGGRSPPCWEPDVKETPAYTRHAHGHTTPPSLSHHDVHHEAD